MIAPGVFYTGSPYAGASGTVTVTSSGNFIAVPTSYSYLGIGGTSYGPKSIAPINAGNYTVTASYSGDATYAPSQSSLAFTISQASSTTVVLAPSDAYTGLPYAGASGTVTGAGGLSEVPSYSYDGISTNGTSYGPTANAPTNAGSYTVTASYSGDANHTSSTNGAVAFTIGKAALTVTANAQNKTYGQLLTFGDGSTQFNSSGLQNGETIGSVTLTVSNNGGAATAAVGNYTITPKLATGGTFSASNYTISYDPGTLTVGQAALTVTAMAESKTYGLTATFGSGSTLFTSSGLQNGETIGSVTLAVSGNGGAPTAAVGSYTITPSAATGGTFTASNYNITYDTGTLTVGQAALTVTASAENKTYGQTATFGSDSTLFTSSGLQNGETIGSVTLAVSGNGGAPTAAVGSYTITPSAATGGTFTASNYNITYATGTLTVGQAPLTVTASAESKTYGQTVTFGSGSTLFTNSPLQNGETIDSVTLAVSGNGGAASAAVGTYTITPSLATGSTFMASNYNITYAIGTLTVNAAVLTVTADAESKTYGQTVSFGGGSTLFTSSGLQNGQTIGSVTLAVSGNGGAATAAVGSYTITPSSSTGGTFTASNYNISYATGTLTVGQAPLTVTASAESKTYGQTVSFGSGSTLFTSSGLQNGETIGSVTLAVSNNGGAAGGSDRAATRSPPARPRAGLSRPATTTSVTPPAR